MASERAGGGCEDPSRIVNCHVHTFTIDHVPEGFVRFGLMRALRAPAVRRTLALLGQVLPSRVLGERVARFMQFAEVAHLKSQGEIFAHLQGFYPSGTRFVVLPMDFSFMGAGAPRRGLEEQHDELLELAAGAGGALVPFLHVDPRWPDAPLRARRLLERGCRGVKLYPALGYLPTDERLWPILELAQEAGVPVMTHCSPGGIRARGLSHAQAAALCHPEHYRRVAEAFPRLRICLAHYGGYPEWAAYRKKNRRVRSEPSWVSIISDLMCTHEHVYADISYTMFRFQEFVPILRILLTNPRIRERVMFGSDYYMVELEEATEREVSIEIRAALGEELFALVAERNPTHWLEGAARGSTVG